jgi:hypothetical protein
MYSQGKMWFEFLFLPLRLHFSLKLVTPLQATILPRACSHSLERSEPPTFQIQSSLNRSNKNCRLGYIEGSDTKTFPTKPQKTTPSAACLVVSLYRQGGARAIIVMPKLCVVE